MQIRERLSHLSPERRNLLLRHLLRAKRDDLEQIPREKAYHAKYTSILAEQGVILGSLAFKTSWILDHWNPQAPQFYYHIADLFDVMDVLTPTLLTSIMSSLVKHHDILRLRIRGKRGEWEQIITDSEEIPIYWVDLSRIPAIEQIISTERIARDLHKSLNPFNEPLVRVVYFKRGNDVHDQMLFIIHHIITDGYSQSIIYEDLEMIYKQLIQDREISLPRKTVSFKRWSEHVMNYVQEKLQRDFGWLNYYQSLPWHKLKPLPADYPEDYSQPTRHYEREFTVSLARTEIDTLQKWLPHLKMQLLEVLVATLVQAFARWTGVPVLYLMLTDNGRFIFPDLDVSRTVGAFIQSKWYFLDLSNCSSTEDMLIQAKQQMRSTPNMGSDLEFACSYIKNEEIQEKLKHLTNYQIRFNFLGTGFSNLHSINNMQDDRIFRWVPGNVQAPADVHFDKNFKLHCAAIFFQEEFSVTWRHDESVYHRSTIDKLAQYYMEGLQKLAEQAKTFLLK